MNLRQRDIPSNGLNLDPGLHKKQKTQIRKFAAKRVMALVFWDKLTILLIKFFQIGSNMTGSKYAEVLGNLRQAIRQKREGMWKKGVYLLHDDTPCHTSRVSQNAIRELGFMELNHFPYSPDLAPRDYFLLPRLKNYLRKK